MMYSSRFLLLAVSYAMLCLSALAAETPVSEPANRFAPPPASAFVSTDGQRFKVNGRPFRVAGYNNHYLTYGTRDEVLRVLDDAVAMNGNVIRTFVTPIIGSPDGKMPTIWDWKSKADSSNLGVKGVYMAYWDIAAGKMEINEGPDGLQRIDFLLEEARKRGLRVILAFMDFWHYTGGAQQVIAWHGGGENKFHDFAASAEAREDYKRLVAAVIGRTNTLNGRLYRDDPTIFAWNLMNEPEIGPYSLQREWLKEMAVYVKSLDRNHMLASGLSSIKTKMAELNIKQFDFGTWHGYPTYQKISAGEFTKQVHSFCALGKAYAKPVILEEFGLPRDDPGQTDAYRSWLEAIRSDERCGGWLVWRLVSRQEHGALPRDDYDKFDIYNDGSPVSNVLRDAAASLNDHKPSPVIEMGRAEGPAGEGKAQ